MTDFVSNIGLFSGSHEDIQDMRIASAQHVEEYLDKQPKIDSHNFMCYRGCAEISFQSVSPYDQDANEQRIKTENQEVSNFEISNQIISGQCSAWGTKWDISGSAQLYGESQNDSMNHPVSNIPGMFHRFQVSFDTANNPPVQWILDISARFGELLIQFTHNDYSSCKLVESVLFPGAEIDFQFHEYVEPGESYDDVSEDNEPLEHDDTLDGQFLEGLLKEIEERQKENLDEIAPLSDLQSSMMQAIFQDDKIALLALTDDSHFKPFGSWSLLHYAAHAEAVDIVSDLLLRGADVRAQSNNGITPMDVLLDARNDNISNVYADLGKRTSILEAFLAQDPSLIREPLTFTKEPADIMARYGMGKMLGVTLLALGNDQDVKDTQIRHMNKLAKFGRSESINEALQIIQSQNSELGAALIKHIIENHPERMKESTNNGILDFMALIPVISKCDQEVLQQLTDIQKGSAEFQAVLSSLYGAAKAHDAMDSIMQEMNVPSTRP